MHDNKLARWPVYRGKRVRGKRKKKKKKKEKRYESKINVLRVYRCSLCLLVPSYARHGLTRERKREIERVEATFFNQAIKREKRIGGNISLDDVEIVIPRNLLPFQLQCNGWKRGELYGNSLNDYRSNGFAFLFFTIFPR